CAQLELCGHWPEQAEFAAGRSAKGCPRCGEDDAGLPGRPVHRTAGTADEEVEGAGHAMHQGGSRSLCQKGRAGGAEIADRRAACTVQGNSGPVSEPRAGRLWCHPAFFSCLSFVLPCIWQMLEGCNELRRK